MPGHRQSYDLARAAHADFAAALPVLVLFSRRARSQDYQRPGAYIFPVEVAQRYLDEISRDIPERLLLLSAKFDVALADLERGTAPRKPYQLLGRRDLPPEIRSKAARSMLGYRGAIALREKMKPLGYPNLVKTREARMRKVAERRLLASVSAGNNGPENMPVDGA